MRITWLGHSCIKVQSGGYSIVIDPYQDGSVPGLRPVRERADNVLCTHEHADHNFRKGITISLSGGTPFEIIEIPSFHDDDGGRKRGENKIYVVSDGKARIAHVGDLGAIPADLSQLMNLDALFLPVGGYYTIDGKQAAELVKMVKPRIAVPMHFRRGSTGYDVLSTEKPFTDQFSSVRYLDSPILDTDEEYGAEVIVLTPMNI